MADRIYSYAPVADANCRRLVLGTAPSVESLRQGFYYAHPRNAFWRIMADLFGEAMPKSIDDKKALLLRNNVALWDVVQSCEREGSLDSAIVCPVANDIPKLLKTCPQIDSIYFNGATAESLFRRHHANAAEGLSLVRLPSTSPAYTLAYANKFAAWSAAFGG